MSVSRPAPLLACLSLAAAVSLPAQEPGKVAYESYQLPNGLTVVLAEHHTAQVVAVNLWYDVGARNEQRGRSGFAHLFEHLMFQGSAHVAKGEFFQLIERAGGSLNGQTEEDITRYFEVVPSNRVNLALWLEADRMQSLAVTDANFENQRAAVKEERRLRVDNQPYQAALLDGLYGAYDSTNCFPYAHSTIGSMEDLDSASTADVQAFFHLYYAPNNARLTVVGDFKPAEIKPLIAQYFGGIPRVDAPPPVACTTEFNQGAVVRKVTDKLANLPATLQFYRIPAHDHADTPALALLEIILGQGESSRLNVKLAREAQAAVSTQAGVFGTRRGPGVFATIAVANQGISADSLNTLLNAEVARIGSEGVTDAELTKAKNVLTASVISDRQRALDIAEALQHAATYHGSLEAVNTDLTRYLAVTADDIKRVAQAYLRPDNALILLVSPGGAS